MMIGQNADSTRREDVSSTPRTLTLPEIIACVRGVAVADEPEHLAARIGEWTDYYQPETILDHFHVEQAARMSLRLNRNWAHDLTLRALAGARAQTCWDEDRKLAAAELGAKLAKNPMLISQQLRASLQGCAWLRERWEGLLALLEIGRDWNESQRALALDLLGTPVELRDEPSRVDPPGVTGEPLRAARREVATEQIARLRWWEEKLEASDEANRQATVLGYPPEITRDMIFFMRQEASNSRRFYRALDHLTRLKRERAEKSASHPSTSTPTTATNLIARSASLSRPAPTPAPAPAPPRFVSALAPVPAPEPEPEPPVAPTPPPSPATATPTAALPPAPPLPLPATPSARSSVFRSVLQGTPGNRRERRAEQSRARRG